MSERFLLPIGIRDYRTQDVKKIDFISNIFLDEAELNYISLIKNSEDIKFKINLYKLYIAKEFFQDALRIISLIKLGSFDLIEVQHDKAYILYLLKSYEESINECNKILIIDNKNSAALNTLGLCYLSLQKYDEANVNLEKALSFDKNNIKILNSLGRLNHELRKSKEAKKYFEKAFKLNSNTFETLNNIAGFYLEESKYKKAIVIIKVQFS